MLRTHEMIPLIFHDCVVACLYDKYFQDVTEIFSDKLTAGKLLCTTTQQQHYYTHHSSPLYDNSPTNPNPRLAVHNSQEGYYSQYSVIQHKQHSHLVLVWEPVWVAGDGTSVLGREGIGVEKKRMHMGGSTVAWFSSTTAT